MLYAEKCSAKERDNRQNLRRSKLKKVTKRQHRQISIVYRRFCSVLFTPPVLFEASVSMCSRLSVAYYVVRK